MGIDFVKITCVTRIVLFIKYGYDLTYYYYYYSSLYLCLLKVLYKCVVNACDICKLQ